MDCVNCGWPLVISPDTDDKMYYCDACDEDFPVEEVERVQTIMQNSLRRRTKRE